jgi:2'-5' RNA ligase
MVNKYFIAIIPSQPLLSELEEIKFDISQRYNNKSALRSPAHITLHMPFELKAEKEDILLNTLSEFKFHSSFSVELKDFSCFEPKVIFVDVVKNETLFELQKNLVYHIKSHLNIFNQAESERGFHPHVTIAFRDLKKEAFYMAYEEFKQKVFSAHFDCNSFWLLKHADRKWHPFQEFFLT